MPSSALTLATSLRYFSVNTPFYSFKVMPWFHPIFQKFINLFVIRIKFSGFVVLVFIFRLFRSLWSFLLLFALVEVVSWFLYLPTKKRHPSTSYGVPLLHRLFENYYIIILFPHAYPAWSTAYLVSRLSGIDQIWALPVSTLRQI